MIKPNENQEVIIDGSGTEASKPEDFITANMLIHRAIAGIAETIKADGLVSVDMNDVNALFINAGVTFMGTAISSGKDRAKNATDNVVANLHLQGIDISRIRSVLVNITDSGTLMLNELIEVMECLKSVVAEYPLIVIANVNDKTMGEKIRVTVFATYSRP